MTDDLLTDDRLAADAALATVDEAAAAAVAWEGEDRARTEAARPKAIKFDALRLDGFKSFPERVEILIEPGLTGVVGPNGCGKSNLLEALKWVMGERSAKNMRGGEMSDVIFSGNDRRPARNVAEVVVTLDNRSRTAPVDLNRADVLEVSRRITRGEGGSQYRLNGSEMRYGDLLVLFQDSGSGARSSGIVSQGRVAAIINARASERRSILEEAAGIAGLASRRSATQARLREADENLARAEEALLRSSETLQSLRRQARQAIRRREIDGKAREAQARVVVMRVARNVAETTRSRAAQEANEGKVAEAILAVRRAEAERDAAVAALPGLREARSTAEAALVRAQALRETLADQAQRSLRAVQEADRRIVELAADRQRQDGAVSEARATVERLRDERMVIAEQRADESMHMEEASDRVEEVRAEVERADARMAAAGALVAGREATLAAAVRTRDEARNRADAVDARLRQSAERLDAARQALPDPVREAALAEAAALADARLEGAQDALASREEALSEAQAADGDAAGAKAAADAALSRLVAEADGLRVDDVDDGDADPVSGRLSVEPGYEVAVAAAFGDALSRGTGEGGGLRWTGLATQPPTGHGRTLADVTSGVPEVEAAARAVLVADVPPASLPFGFRSVSRDGVVSGWDGLRGRAATDRVAARLRRANRLKALEVEVAAANGCAIEAGAAREVAARELSDARTGESSARLASREALDALLRAREDVASLERGAADARQRYAVAEAEVEAARADRAASLEVLAEASDALASLPPDEEARAELATARRRVADLREGEAKLRTALERLVQDANQRRSRFDAILRDESQWTQRLTAAIEARADVGRRADEAQAQRDEILTLPAASPEALLSADEEIEAAGAATVEAARRADDAERARTASDDALRSREADLAALREARVSLVAAMEAAKRESEATDALVLERMTDSQGSPLTLEVITALANMGDGDLPKDVQQAETRLTRLERERENLGAVNFLAEQQLAEQEKQYGEVTAQREDLRQTLVKLRQGLAEIESEGRARLEEAFRKIDASFGELFSRLFSGGQAHLRLVDSEDVLEAGLEIYASPPGKRLQVMSLLSGGEQSLTAMALIFAVFLANPAPVCVLDEVDAALDDANTDRLCRMVEAMAENDATRFLVVTHSPLTMARMNRLYGVTMQERGVSSVTRVDLDKAIAIVDSN